MGSWQMARRIVQGILRRRKRLALISFLVAAVLLGPVAYYFANEKPRYRTSATILFETRADRLPLFQEFSPFRPLPVQLAILHSRSLAESVLESLPKASLQDLIDNPYYVDYGLRIKNAYLRLIRAEPEVESPRERALKELQNARVKFNSHGHGIVEMGAEASKPQIAIDILSSYIEVLLSRTRSFNLDDARVTREFLEQQVADVKRSLKESEEAIEAFTAGHGGIRLPEQNLAALARLSSAENALAETTSNRKMAEARLQELRKKVETQKSSSPASAAAPAAPRPVPPALQRLREQLARLEATLLELRMKYTDEHPRVILVRNQLAELERALAAVVRETTDVTPAPAAVPAAERVDFSEQVLALETFLHLLTAREEALRKQVESLRQSLGGLSRTEMEYSRLWRDVESHRNLYTLLSGKLTAARIREQGEMKVVKVIDPPGLGPQRFSKRGLAFAGFALALTLTLGAGVPAVVEYVKRPVENEADVEGSTGLPVLAVIPRLRGQEPLFLAAEEIQALGKRRRFRQDYLFSEAFRTLRVKLQLAARRGELRTLLVTSAFPTEGKSTVVVNLGLAFSEAGRRVILADTDILRPALHQILDVPDEGGLVDVLHARREVEQALVPVGDGVWLAPRGGELRPGTRGILATSRLRELLDKLRGQGDLILCDSAPVLLVPDSLFLAAAVDGVILVVKAGQTSGRDLARAKAAVEGVGARLVGVVLNDVSPSTLKYRYYLA